MSEVEILIQQNIWLIYAIVLWIFVLILGVNFWKGRGKIMVRVKTPLKEEIYWRKPIVTERGNEIVMEKTTKKNIGWSFTFTNKSLIPKKRFLGLRNYFVVDVFPRARKAIEYDYESNSVDMPLLSQKDAAEINRLDSFKRRYGKVEQPKSTFAIWVVLALVLAILIFQFLQMQGVRIG